MNNTIKFLLLLLNILIFQSCSGQETETFWKSDNVIKIDSKPFWGITLSYMDMIAEMRIHLSKNNDSIIFGYPYEKKMKISELKSLTNCRISSTGKLLDSIYDVRIENDLLKIKFHYLGTLDKENRFSLNLVKVKKEDYLSEVKNLQASVKNILDRISTTDLSNLEIIGKPEYLLKENELLKLNPIQLAEELTNAKNTLQLISRTFTLSKNKNPIDYKSSGIINTNKINKNTAQIDHIKFSNIELITNLKDKQTKAVIVSEDDMNKTDIIHLYNHIAEKMKGGSVRQFGLPLHYKEGDSLGIHNFIAITWKDKNKVVKLALDEIPDDLWDMEIHNGIALKDEEYTSKDIDFVFRHYLGLLKKSTIKLFIVSNEFDEVLNHKENNRQSLTYGNINDYVFKWKYLTEIWDNE